jgi:hypothetical protein
MKPHAHHITPRHKGGDNSPENLVLLDPVKHAEIHAFRFLDGDDNWFCAMQEGWPLLDTNLRDEVLAKMSSHNLMKNPETVAKVRKTREERGLNEQTSQRMRDNNPMKNPEIAAKVSKAKKGQPSTRLGVTLSDETKEKLRLANLGKKHTDEAKQKMSKSRTGKKRGPYKKWSDEDKQAHSERMKKVAERRRFNG